MRAIIVWFLTGVTLVSFQSTGTASEAFPASLDLSTLDGTNGFVLFVLGSGDRTGFSVSGIGDVNADGLPDVAIGARDASPGGSAQSGRAFVVFGSAAPFPASFDLANLNGTNGFELVGAEDNDGAGASVSGLGDMNGDGIDDLAIGASGTSKVHVVFGSDSPFPASFDLATLDGTNGFTVLGREAGDQLGGQVAGAGDVNGDGLPDLVIGARVALSVRGESYVVFGSALGFSASLAVSDLDGANGFVIPGISANDQSGSSVAGAGDVNGDGVDDFLVGSMNATPGGRLRAGESYVVFGTDAGFPASLSLSTLDGTNGFQMNGIDPEDDSGGSVAGVGDVNGDGIDDVAVGASSAAGGRGEVYVVFGSSTGFPASIEFASLDGTNGFLVSGADAGDVQVVDVQDMVDVEQVAAQLAQ